MNTKNNLLIKKFYNSANVCKAMHKLVFLNKKNDENKSSPFDGFFG